MDSYLQRLQQTLADAIRGMTLDELTRHAEGKWSVAEELEHLYLTYTGTAKVFERCLEVGRPMATRPSLKQRAMVAVVVESASTNSRAVPSASSSPSLTCNRNQG
jgi:hypothetical protein